jgi:hypothetical protein
MRMCALAGQRVVIVAGREQLYGCGCNATCWPAGGLPGKERSGAGGAVAFVDAWWQGGV